MSNPAASERRRKEAHPEKFCPNSRCLWRKASGPCPRHQSEARNQLSQDAREGYGLTCPESHAAERSRRSHLEETMSARERMRERMQVVIRTYLGLGGSAYAVVGTLIIELDDRDDAADKDDGDVRADILSQLH